MPIKRRSEAGRDEDDRRSRSSRDDEDDRYYRGGDDDEDDRPRRRRGRDYDDERDEDPPRRSRRSRDDDDEEDDRPRRSRRSRDDDDEDEDDRRGGRRRARDEDEDEEDDRRSSRGRGRGRERDEDEERGSRDRDRGRGRSHRDDDDDRDDRRDDRGRGRGRGDSSVRDGWSGAKKVQEQSSDFAQNFKTEVDKSYVIRFLDEGPYAAYRQHWLERSGKRSFVCPEDPDDDKSPLCPLCDVGDKPRAQYAFNVVVLDEREKPAIRSWDVGIKLFQKLERISKDPKYDGLNGIYFEVIRTGGKGGSSDTALNPIKERDLYDDFGIEPLTDKEFDALQRKGYDKSFVTVPGVSELKALAKELTRYDDR